MALTREEVRRVAQLARLELSEAEESALAGELSRILDYVKQLEALDVTGVPPMTHALDAAPELRADEVQPSLAPGEALLNAPQREGTAFAVPKVIE